MICQNGTCRCGTEFQEKQLTDQHYVCEPAPNEIGARCTTNCKPPLICIDGKCECLRPTSVQGRQCIVDCPSGQVRIGHECRNVARIHQLCTLDTVCIDPLTSCQNGICSCVTGRLNGLQCEPICADGRVAGTPCKKLFDGFPQIIDESDKSDTCPDGQQCITWGNPLVGRCCPISCPYGTAITGRSCQPSATNPCEDENYYCYKIQVRNKNKQK